MKTRFRRLRKYIQYQRRPPTQKPIHTKSGVQGLRFGFCTGVCAYGNHIRFDVDKNEEKL